MDGQTVLPGFDEFIDESISPEEARRISAEARLLFETMDYVTWMGDYLVLRKEGWPWRVACYIAWASTPRKLRWPSTQEELASVLGLKSGRAIHKWRQKNPQIDARVASCGASILMKFRDNVLEALGLSASRSDSKHNSDRRLYLEMTGDYTPRQELEATITRPGIFLPESGKQEESPSVPSQEEDG